VGNASATSHAGSPSTQASATGRAPAWERRSRACRPRTAQARKATASCSVVGATGFPSEAPGQPQGSKGGLTEAASETMAGRAGTSLHLLTPLQQQQERIAFTPSALSGAPFTPQQLNSKVGRTIVAKTCSQAFATGLVPTCSRRSRASRRRIAEASRAWTSCSVAGPTGFQSQAPVLPQAVMAGLSEAALVSSLLCPLPRPPGPPREREAKSLGPCLWPRAPSTT